MAKAMKDTDVEPKPQKRGKKARKAKKAKKPKKVKKHALMKRTIQWLKVSDPEIGTMATLPVADRLPENAVALDYEVDGTSFPVSQQFVEEFLRYMDTQFVTYERFPALVQHILLMRRHVTTAQG